MRHTFVTALLTLLVTTAQAAEVRVPNSRVSYVLEQNGQGANTSIIYVDAQQETATSGPRNFLSLKCDGQGGFFFTLNTRGTLYGAGQEDKLSALYQVQYQIGSAAPRGVSGLRAPTSGGKLLTGALSLNGTDVNDAIGKALDDGQTVRLTLTPTDQAPASGKLDLSFSGKGFKTATTAANGCRSGSAETRVPDSNVYYKPVSQDGKNLSEIYLDARGTAGTQGRAFLNQTCFGGGTSVFSIVAPTPLLNTTLKDKAASIYTVTYAVGGGAAATPDKLLPTDNPKALALADKAASSALIAALKAGKSVQIVVKPRAGALTDQTLTYQFDAAGYVTAWNAVKACQ